MFRVGTKTIKIPNLRYTLKGDFKDGAPSGSLEGYIYESKSDAAGIINDIIRKDISGEYSKGKFVKSSVVKKIEPKKLVRPEFKVDDIEPTQGIIQASNLAEEIGCSGYEVKGMIRSWIIYPCQSYKDYEEAMKKSVTDTSKKTINNKVILKTGLSLFQNISKDTSESFFVKGLKVTKYKNTSTIQKIDFNIFGCEIINSKNTNNKDLYFEKTKYIVDIENGLITRKRFDKNNDNLEEKTFNILELVGDFNRFSYTFFDREKKKYVLTESKEAIRDFIVKNKNSKFLEIKTHPIEVIRQMDFIGDNVKDYNLALSDESLKILIPLNFKEGKGAYSLDDNDNKYMSKGYVTINSSFGVFLEVTKAGTEKWVTYNPIDEGKQIKEACKNVSKDKSTNIKIADSEVKNVNMIGSIKYYQKIINDRILSLINYGIAGEEAAFFDGYYATPDNTGFWVDRSDAPAFGITSEREINASLEKKGVVKKSEELKFEFVLKCETGDFYFINLNTNFKRKNDKKVIHLIRISKNRDRFKIYSAQVDDWPKYTQEYYDQGLIRYQINLTNSKDWQSRFNSKTGYIINDDLEIDLSTNKVSRKYLKFWSANTSHSWYQPAKEIEENISCKKISLKNIN